MGSISKLKDLTGSSRLGALDPDSPLGAPSGFDGLAGLTGESAAEAAEEMARLQREYAERAIAQERQQFDKTFAQQRPFIEAGVRQLPMLERSATAKGYADDIAGVLGGDVAQTRQALIEDYAPMGLRRDLAGVGDMRVREAMGIADILNQRKQSLAGKGLTSSGFTAGAGQHSAGNISNLLSGIGAAQSQSRLMQAQATQQGLTNLGNLVVGAYDYYRNRPQA